MDERGQGRVMMDGLVLAGGRGTRMRAQAEPMLDSVQDRYDKGLVQLSGQPLLAHVVATLRPLVDEMFISISANLPAYEQWGRCLSDQVDEQGLIPYAGPLAGVLAGLNASRAEWLAVAPCDSPFLPAHWATILLAHARHAGSALAVARHKGVRHPVCMVLRCDLRESLSRYLAAGGRKVGAWQHDLQATAVDFDACAEHAFMNINLPAELAQAQALYGMPPKYQPSQRESS